jgi:hypothetical protein
VNWRYVPLLARRNSELKDWLRERKIGQFLPFMLF